MIRWVSLSVEARPVPRPVATPLVWATAFGGALLLVAVHNLLIGPDRPGFALAGLSLLAALLGLCARFTAAPGTAVLCWLFLNGFAIPPAGTLTWTGSRDTVWLACLFTASLVGTILARIVHARAAYRRVTAGTATPTAGSRDWRDTF
ncbi:hypothetical protein ACWHLZ_11950 [Streptomyces chartreusis]|jgi:hypothetical protein|uniref:hypothetical protein n=1 Tax=Streptomyces TaxID=1883 RepID=UPI002E8105C8|nr:hypothetical protein [Streptomyces chartreusis]WSZ66376.1 hypothetical protein OG938_11250 [Streptomyces chartreusis]WTA30770.1 hypothetical protein OIA45_34160 [Streptomyces chartreusis]WUB21257.1 hypothetical protein OG997_33050 [Streptomyces chartreusis]